MNILSLFFAVSVILFLGYIAEYLFSKTKIPDVLFLIVIGFILGPNIANIVTPASVAFIAPVFTTFTLLFLLFDGSFNLELKQLSKGMSSSLSISLFNFFASVIGTGAVLLLFGYPVLTALMAGFFLGGVSSAFVIPLIKNIKEKELATPILTIESAITDVFAIVFSLTIMQLIELQSTSVDFQAMFSQIASLFAIAALVGVVGGIAWIIINKKVFKADKPYIMTIAWLLMVFVVTEFLNGNGALAGLFFGFVLKNSQELGSMAHVASGKKVKDDQKALYNLNPHERFFYSQISFILKVFFFVYLGILLNISDTKALIVGGVIAFAIMAARRGSMLLTKGMTDFTRDLIAAVFGRGLAPAAIVLIAVEKGLPGAAELANIAYVVIVGTIILSSALVFKMQRSHAKD